MLAEKPIVIALPGKTGMVYELWENRGEARRLGESGRDYYATLGISWKNVVGKLLGEGRLLDFRHGSTSHP